jgi:Zn-dependent peptidase ImmA (M78 family)
MLSGYIPTDIERKVEMLYRERNILAPPDLEISKVAKLFNVYVDYSKGPQRAIWDEDTSVIFINPNQAEEKQREVFFHELCHPLMHYGDQTKMHCKSFRDLQEFQANQFQLYAAVPFYMLKELDLPVYEYQIINTIRVTFKIPLSLAKKRFDQIKRRIFQAQIDGKVDFHYSSVY